MFEYEDEIGLFAASLKEFIAKYELPDSWFKKPDHLAIKCADGLDYVFRMEELIPDAVQASEITMDGRRLATLKLTSEVSVGDLGAVSWLEVMEPRPEKVGNDVVGLEHIEFYYPDFDEVTDLLDKLGVVYKIETNPGHSWVNIVINEAGQELKLNDKTLEDIVTEELEQGISRLL
jgi:hypothetical protein